MYNAICAKHGPQIALELMSSLDTEGHSVLDWACDSGHVNIIEFFIRKGMNPFRADGMNRGPLFWAIKSRRVDATRFLVLCGCNPLQRDANDQSPLSLATAAQDKQLLEALSYSKCASVDTSDQAYVSVHTTCPGAAPKLYSTIRNKNRSHAIYRRNRPQLRDTMIFFAIFAVFWLLTVFLSFYWDLLIFSGLYLIYR